MKKTLIFAFIAVIVTFLTGCNGLKKMVQNADDIKYSVNPQVLEVHNGKVNVSITGTFPEKYFNKKVTATITPTLVYEGKEKTLTPVYVQGEKIKGNAKVIQYKPGGAFSYNETFDYTPEMRRSKLELRITATKGKKTVDFEPEFVADGIVATPYLVKMIGKCTFAKDKFVKDIPDTRKAQINYDKNKADLKPTELKRDDINSLKDYIFNAVQNDRIELKEVQLQSYASPEGTLEINTKVSNDRSKTVTKFVKEEFKKVDQFKNDDFFKYLVTEEDWDGFKKMVSESNLADKDLILRVVNMHTDPDKREEEIRNMKATFEELEKYIHPLLRRSEIIVNVMLIGKTDEEIDQVFAQNPETLTVEELLYLGQISTDLDKKLAVYTKTTELYPKDWRGFNNLSAVQYRKGDYQAAKTSIEKAKSLEANANVFNNLANVNLALGDVKEAETNYKSATGIPEAALGQGVIAIKQGQYKNAVDFFGESKTFNAALAQLLNKDYDKAIRTIDASDEKDDAMAYYLKAIIGARKNDSDMVFNNLRTACSKKPELKEFAANDVEFLKYFENDTFKTIVK